MNDYARSVWVIAGGGLLLAAAAGTIGYTTDAPGDPAAIDSPDDTAGGTGNPAADEEPRMHGDSMERASSLGPVPHTLPPVVFEFPDADLSLIEPATLEEFFTSHRMVRFRVVTVDTDEIREVIRDKLRGVDRVVTIRFFPDVVVSAMTFTTSKEGYTGQNAGFAVWSGMEVGTTSASMAMAISPDGETIGEFSTSKGNFNIAATTQPPFHIVWQDLPDSELGPID